MACLAWTSPEDEQAVAGRGRRGGSAQGQVLGQHMPITLHRVVAFAHRSHYRERRGRRHDIEFPSCGGGTQVPPLRRQRRQRHPTPAARGKAFASHRGTPGTNLAPNHIQSAHQDQRGVTRARCLHAAGRSPLAHQPCVCLEGLIVLLVAIRWQRGRESHWIELLTICQVSHSLHATVRRATRHDESTAKCCNVVATTCRDHRLQLLPTAARDIQPFT
mmetsp:Transcript_146861/g.366249  ORF Transcript_146861/g.366249 Transcript_146861/m.366249 type:complete len:218 (-) Transcript_146861:1064-1717(-)